MHCSSEQHPELVPAFRELKFSEPELQELELVFSLFEPYSLAILHEAATNVSNALLGGTHRYNEKILIHKVVTALKDARDHKHRAYPNQPRLEFMQHRLADISE